MKPGSPLLAATLFGLLALLAALSLHLGVRAYAPAEVWRALTGTGQEATDLIVRTLRLPRLVLAVTVGAALGVAGLLMQTATRNRLAEPGLLGVNAGAAFAAVLVVTLTGTSALWTLALAASAGAVVAAALVFSLALSAGQGNLPVTVLLAGVTVGAMLASGTQVVIILDESAMEEMLFWLAGAFADRPLGGLAYALPVMLAVLGLAFAGARTLDVLQTDDGTAAALGVPVRAVRVGALLGAALLAGASVALAGPVAFVGLVAPHVARLLGAQGHAAQLTYSALCGALVALSADVAARFLIYPGEAPVSAVTAMIGVPALILLLRRSRAVAA